MAASIEVECCGQVAWEKEDQLFPFDSSGLGDWQAQGMKQCGSCGTLHGPVAEELLVDATDSEVAAAAKRVAAKALAIITAEIAEMVAVLDTDLDEFVENPDDTQTSDGYEPGIMVEGDVVTAWAYVPGAKDDGMVTVSRTWTGGVR